MTETILYIATNKTTGLRYAGITRTALRKRWSAHVRMAATLDNKFHAAIAQYGAGDFEVEEIHRYSTWLLAAEAEMDVIAGLNLIEAGYNTSPGGNLLSDTSIAKMAATKTGRTLTAEHKAKIGMAIHSEDSRRRQAEKLRGHKKSPEHVAKVAAANRGKKRSVEARERMSQAAKRRFAAMEMSL